MGCLSVSRSGPPRSADVRDQRAMTLRLKCRVTVTVPSFAEISAGKLPEAEGLHESRPDMLSKVAPAGSLVVTLTRLPFRSGLPSGSLTMNTASSWSPRLTFTSSGPSMTGGRLSACAPDALMNNVITIAKISLVISPLLLNEGTTRAPEATREPCQFIA